ncbi:DUF2285 domain-containing protein [Caulobacter sp. 602-2]|uniref:DUF2285 domain-containing protein n=1 Tax=Caulobacter sp. 602-2 TaxID=2710887 RepID=A0A6G4QV24_9CAUL|nr:DUF2285 domain-containing protein [Caulobacter sp. 602-2]NGM49382.1 DUF2285 domain-containing protein [Caulobacter sp. 602-2]
MADALRQDEGWRSVEAYRPLLDADASAWAWEFARRATAADGSVGRAPPDLCFAGAGPASSPVPAAMWRFETDPSMPVFLHAPARGGETDAIDIRRLPLATVVVSNAAGTHQVMVADGVRRLRFAVIGGDVLGGAIRLLYPLPAKGKGGAGLDGVRRLLALRDTGRLPAAAAGVRGRPLRWLAALRAFDARQRGASQREIACLLFGAARVSEDWTSQSAYMRMRIQRLVRSSQHLVAGGYRRVFGLLPAGPIGAAAITVWRSPAWAAATCP